MKQRELRDITSMPPLTPEEMARVQRKISLAGDMRLAIKRFLDDWDKPDWARGQTEVKS